MDDLTRRDFLRAAGLAAAGMVGTAALAGSSFAQEQDKPKEKPDENESEPETEPETEEEPNYDELFAEDEDDDEDEESRACPQCGALMFRQGRTWTCENCGYSYVE